VARRKCGVRDPLPCRAAQNAAGRSTSPNGTNRKEFEWVELRTSILKGLNQSAQGCRASDYPGFGVNRMINPEGVESNRFVPHHPHVSQSLAKILVHTVFSTKDRRPFLRDKPLRKELHRYIGGILTNLECQPVIVGGVEDHVHLLCALARTCDAAAMVKEIKRGSSLWLKTKSLDLADFAWQNGYGIFSIGFSQIESVRKYIAGQEEHHRKVTFQDEFRQLLRRYEIEFDERYVWD
jgi:putative transposase